MCFAELAAAGMQADPGLTVPYDVTPSGERVGGLPLTLSLGAREELWSQALKFLLTDLKWLLAWTLRQQIAPS